MYLDDNVQQALRHMNKIAINEVLKKEGDLLDFTLTFFNKCILDIVNSLYVVCTRQLRKSIKSFLRS